MSRENKETIQSYEQRAVDYIDGTPHDVNGVFKTFLDITVEGLPKHADILEIGSAFGRDAAYIESLGYSVQRSDITDAFIETLSNQGYDVEKLNVVDGNLGKERDLIFAQAVLLHLPKNEFIQALTNMASSLKVGGRLSFSLKEGEGEEVSEEKLHAPRYFKYWRADEVDEVLQSIGFVARIETVDAGKNRWLHVIAEKAEL